MIEVRESSPDEAAEWSAQWKARLAAWFGSFDAPTGWVTQQVERNVAARAESEPVSATYTLVRDGAPVGFLDLSDREGANPSVAINDLVVRPEYRRAGVARAAVDWAIEHARDRGPALWVTADPADAGYAAVFASFPVRAQRMLKALVEPDPLPDGVTAGPMTPDEFTEWRLASIAEYADEIASSGTLPRPEAEQRSEEQFDGLLPDGVATEGHSFWVLRSGGRQVATNWLRHGFLPGTSFVFGVEVGAEFRGRGLGRAAMAVGERATLDAGDTHLGLNVFGHNHVAMNLYSAMGYVVTDRSRSLTF